MTYPPGGYPPAQSPGSYGAPTPAVPAAGDSESKLPLYLKIAVAALGLVVYLASFGPMYDTDSSYEISVVGSWPSTAALLAALLLGVGLLPKAKDYTPIATVIAVLGALLAISEIFDRPLVKADEASIGWGLWLVVAFTVIQAIVAVVALLLDAGVITAPAPKPQYDPYQQQYGVAPGGYYGQPPQAPAQYGGYPSTGGFSAPPAPQGPPLQHQGPPTPPTGFPSFSPPPSVGPGPDAGQQPSPAAPPGPQPS